MVGVEGEASGRVDEGVGRGGKAGGGVGVAAEGREGRRIDFVEVWVVDEVVQVAATWLDLGLRRGERSVSPGRTEEWEETYVDGALAAVAARRYRRRS